ncbi:alginate export family protein [Aquimarina sp. AU474]|uniref:alginate export family protein n=1 Tax=Aquimarina sp. AU474 TaxID=2108529 RepID=UPI000D6934C5|nr:alginate export family protein [Aquimarina sp. AU474]
MKLIRLSVKAFFVLFFATVHAQLDIDADLRSRFEYLHGFNNLFPNDADPAAFVTQRSRLNIGFKQEKLKIFISVQDVSTWGDTRQILINDGNDSFSLFQAWGQIFLNSNWSLKAGRQVISYDDQRIFGGLDWAMQGRFHDAALIKYENETFKTDIGAAFNQEGQSNEGTLFNIQGFFTYKTMQYGYLKKQWGKRSASFLFLNTGFQKFKGINNDEPDGVFYRQTTGSYFTFPVRDINVTGSAYYQFGKSDANTDLSAYQISLEAIYKPGKILYGLGVEFLSGTDQDGDDKNKSFFPLYGTNHKFNGYMDYFYVGNHANNVGLNDLYAKVVFTTGKKSSLLFKVHYFMANADLIGNADKYLGTEVDLVFKQQLIKNVKLNIGYSHMFASENMSLIKGGRPHDNINNWGWAQLIINPKLFRADFKKENE